MISAKPLAALAVVALATVGAIATLTASATIKLNDTKCEAWIHHVPELGTCTGTFMPKASPTPTPTPTGTPTATPTPTPTASPSPTAPPGTAHVLVIMEENKGYAATLGTCSADPYFCSLAAQYASFTNSHGVTHPSEPNYVAFESGSVGACTTDSSCAAGTVTRQDLGGQLTAAGVPWVGWMESMPSACYKGGSSGGYVLKHSFGGFFTDEYTGACRIQPYPGVTNAVAQLDAASAPDFVWITPNLTDDMHDGSVQQGDAWLKANLAPVLSSPWFTGFISTIIVTQDEGDAGSTNQIPTVVISSNAHGAVTTSINHYAVLRAIEATFGLSFLGSAASAPDISRYFG